MGLDYQEGVDVIVGSTSEYLVEFLPIGAFIIAVILTFGIIEWLIQLLMDIYHYKYNRGYAPGDYMAGLPGMTDDDRNYYTSGDYPANWDWQKYRSHQKRYRAGERDFE